MGQSHHDGHLFSLCIRIHIGWEDDCFDSHLGSTPETSVHFAKAATAQQFDDLNLLALVLTRVECPPMMCDETKR